MCNEKALSDLSAGTPVKIVMPGIPDFEVAGQIDGPMFERDGHKFYPVETETHIVECPLGRLMIGVDPKRVYEVTPLDGVPILLTGEQFLVLSVHSHAVRFTVKATS